jgi:hypothetical protein
MPTSLCGACRSIIADLFSAALDDPVSIERPGWSHLPLKWIERSAHAGCPFCTCLIAGADPAPFLEAVLECTRVRLKRALIDLNQAIVMSVGLDDVSHTYFSCIPAQLCKFAVESYQSRFLSFF